MAGGNCSTKIPTFFIAERINLPSQGIIFLPGNRISGEMNYFLLQKPCTLSLPSGQFILFLRKKSGIAGAGVDIQQSKG